LPKDSSLCEDQDTSVTLIRAYSRGKKSECFRPKPFVSIPTESDVCCRFASANQVLYGSYDRLNEAGHGVTGRRPVWPPKFARVEIDMLGNAGADWA
jgi:hypothetical protein